MAHWKAHVRLSIRVNWTFFAIYITVPELWCEICTARLFSHEGWPLCTQILPGQGRPPSTILGTRKLETLRYAMVKTASLCVPWFWHNRVPECDGQTDGRICRSIYCACNASFAARCNNQEGAVRKISLINLEAQSRQHSIPDTLLYISRYFEELRNILNKTDRVTAKQNTCYRKSAHRRKHWRLLPTVQ